MSHARAGLEPNDVRVLAEILRQLLRAEPVDAPVLCAGAGLSRADVESALRRLDAAGIVYADGGSVSAAYPLSAVPTRHRVRIGARTAYANCAVDALAVPLMVDEAVWIESACGHCGAAIAVAAHGERIVESRPAAPVVFHVHRDCCGAGPAVLTRCPHINFFCDASHAQRWLAAHPTLSGDVLPLVQAAARARDRFASIIRLSRGEMVRPADLRGG
jgi:alkylmercury lyase-like protein